MERLQKILSQAGIASRRASEQLMLDGRVTVNGATVGLSGTTVAIGGAVIGPTRVTLTAGNGITESGSITTAMLSGTAAFMRQLPCYRLHIGTDMARIAARVADQVRNGA